MIFYRVDKKEYAIGSKITNVATYYNNLDLSGKRIEDTLEGNRPFYLPNRKSSIFLFKNLQDAFEFWLKLNDSKIYEVETSIINCFYIFDMNITEKMKGSKEYNDYAKKYWEKYKSDNYTPECLCRYKKPIIKKILIENNNPIRKSIYLVTRGYFPESLKLIDESNTFIDNNNLRQFIKDDKLQYLDRKYFISEYKY